MNFLKKNVFWIVLAVIVLAGIGVWFVMVPGVSASAEEYKTKCKDKIADFERLAKKAESKDDTTPESIKNRKHAELAAEFGKRVKAQLEDLRAGLAKKKLELRFDVSGVTPSDYDTKLKELRDAICKQAEQAGLQFPPEERKRLMFEGSTTDDRASKVELHWNYRLRQMAIVEEVVNILCKKPVKQPVLKFEPKKDTAESQTEVDVGAQALERLTILPPKAAGTAKGPTVTMATGEARSVSGMSSDERARLWTDEAWRRGGRSNIGGSSRAADRYQELPYSITSVDIQFLAPLIAVPAIVQALETSERYSAAVTRVECQRAVRPYPEEKDPKLAKAEPVTGLNTHYQEGPVRVLVSLDIYEYDDAKAKAAEVAANTPAPEEKGTAKKGAEAKK